MGDKEEVASFVASPADVTVLWNLIRIEHHWPSDRREQVVRTQNLLVV